MLELSLPEVSIPVFKAVLAYVTCSSLMLVANKVAITFIPLPASVFAVQLAAAVTFMFLCKAFKLIEVDSLTMERVKGYIPYTILFVGSIYCNGRALAQSNAETVIVFRSSTPLFVSMMEYAALGRELPNQRSTFALLGVVIGAIGYMQADSEFQMKGILAYFWVSIYTVAICFEMTIGKIMQKKVVLETPVWGAVMFTNTLGLLPMSVLALCSGEIDKISSLPPESTSSISIIILALSCIIGIGIGWSTWNCRNMVSATSFTLIGVSCKIFTVLINMVIWSKHATPIGICWLLVCLVSSSFYRQAPLREVAGSSPEKSMPTQLGNLSQLEEGNDTQEGDEVEDPLVKG